MYQPREFRESDEAWALAHIRRHPFGVLFGRTGSGYAAAHLPFQLASLDSDDTPRDPETADAGDAGGAARDRELTLEGHGAVRNELLTGMPDGSEVLIVFSGPSAYITPGCRRRDEGDGSCRTQRAAEHRPRGMARCRGGVQPRLAGSRFPRG